MSQEHRVTKMHADVAVFDSDEYARMWWVGFWPLKTKSLAIHPPRRLPGHACSLIVNPPAHLVSRESTH